MAIVSGQYGLTKVNCCLEIALFLIVLTQVIGKIKISISVLFTRQCRPFFIRVLFQKIASVEAFCSTIINHGFGQVPALFQMPAQLNSSLELDTINPELQIRIEKITIILESNRVQIRNPAP